MASEVVMPRLGWTMEVGQLVEWLKRDGEAVAAGEALFTVESDKAVSEVEALDSGVLRIPPDAPAAGVELPVGTLLAYLVPAGESAPFEERSTTPPTAPVEPSASPAAAGVADDRAPAAIRRTHRGQPASSPRARRLARELGVDWTIVIGSGVTGRIVARDVRAAADRRPAAPRPRVGPIVRRAAEEAGVDLVRLAAAKPGGRITPADVRAAAVGGRATAAAPRRPAPARVEAPAGIAPPAVSDRTGDIVPLGPVRLRTARRLAASARTVAPVTLTTDADATELVQVRARVAADAAGADGPVPSLTDLLIRLVALALREHPDLNASWSEGGIVRHPAVNVGVAVETERGLVVPVVREAQTKSVGEIAAETGRLIGQARVGTIAPADLRDGTFTITNLGMYGIDAFTPIVNLPECAILGIGRIVARPVVIDEATEAIAVRKMVALSLTFDHRVVDGAPAARFLRRVKGQIEHPYAWLLR